MNDKAFDREKYDFARAEIKARLTMPEILDAYYHTGKQNKICCPFHEEKTPSFSYKDKIWTCFGCGKKGDVIDFVKEYFNISFKEAIEKLDSGFRLNNLDVELTPQRKAEIAEKAAEREKQATEKDKFHEHFMELLDKQAELDQQLKQHEPTENSTPEEIMEYCRISSELEYVNYQVDEATVEIFIKNHGESVLPERKEGRVKAESKMQEQKEPAYTVDDFTKELMDGCLQKTGNHEQYMSKASKLISEFRLAAIARGLVPEENIPDISVTTERVNSIPACNVPPKGIPVTFDQDKYILTLCDKNIHTTDDPQRLIRNLEQASSYVTFMVAVAEETQGLRKAPTQEQAKAETVNQPANAPVENKSKGARRSMKIDVTTHIIDNAAPNDKGNRLLANSTISLDGGTIEFPVRLTEDKDGNKHISMPSYMTKEGEFKSYVVPGSKELFAKFQDAVESSYYATVRGDQLPEQKENITPGYVSVTHVTPLDTDTATKAIGNVRYENGEDRVHINSVRLVESKNGHLFAAMPTTAPYTNRNGDTIYPPAVSAPTRVMTAITSEMRKEYDKALENQKLLESQKQGATPTEPTMGGVIGYAQAAQKANPQVTPDRDEPER